MADEEKNNPRNPDSSLFKKLTRLLSGPVVNYRTQNPRQLRRRQLDKHRFTSASGQQFKKMEHSAYDSLQNAVLVQQNRGERYQDFEQMEYMPEIASAMDIYADEMTTSNEYRKILQVHCPNEEIKSLLQTLYYNVMNIDFNMFGWSRSMCKFGDYFLYLDIDEDYGIKNVIGLPSNELERMEGEDKTNANYVQFQWNTGGVTFENWQIAHFRILGNDKYAPYGTSVLEPARRIWRQLTLIEDAMMAYRIVRSPERRVFYIDVGNVAPQDIEQYMQKVMTQMKRNQVVDADTGRVDLRYNPMSVDEDYFIPVRGTSASRIETLAGGTMTGDIDDVKYLRDKLFSALKVPQSYLTRGEGAEEDKTTLAQKDIRFARTIQRLQRSIISELEKVGVIHLYTLGYRASDLVSFSLSLNNPSKLAEMQELEHWKTKFDTAAAATEGFFSRRWVAHHIFDLSDEEFLRIQREQFFDKKYDAALEAAAEGEAAEAEGGGDLGGDEFGDEEEFGGEEEGGEEGGEEETLLAAPPAHRDDGSYLTPGAKGHRYKPEASDKRGSGARKRSYQGLWSKETGSPTTRNIFKGMQNLQSLGKLRESAEKDLDVEEKTIEEVTHEIKQLIKEMENRSEKNARDKKQTKAQ